MRPAVCASALHPAAAWLPSRSWLRPVRIIVKNGNFVWTAFFISPCWSGFSKLTDLGQQTEPAVDLGDLRIFPVVVMAARCCSQTRCRERIRFSELSGVIQSCRDCLDESLSTASPGAELEGLYRVILAAMVIPMGGAGMGLPL